MGANEMRNDELDDIYSMEESRRIWELDGLPVSDAEFGALVSDFKALGGRKGLWKRYAELHGRGLSTEEVQRAIGEEIKALLKSRGRV